MPNSKILKSLGPIDRKFHGHSEKYGFVSYEDIIQQCSSFCKYTKISVMKKISNKITCKPIEIAFIFSICIYDLPTKK